MTVFTNIKIFIFKNEIFALKNGYARIFIIFAPQFENRLGIQIEMVSWNLYFSAIFLLKIIE